MENNQAILMMLKTKVVDMERDNFSKAKMDAYMQLVNLGLEVVVDKNESIQGYVTVRNPKTGRELVISKDYTNRTRVYGNGKALAENLSFNELIKVLDFYHYLTKPMYSRHRQPTTKVGRYLELKRSLAMRKRLEKQYQEEYDTAKYNLDRSRQYKEAVIQELKEMKK